MVSCTTSWDTILGHKAKTSGLSLATNILVADDLRLRLDVGDLRIHQGMNVDATAIVALTGPFAIPDSIPL